MREEFNSNDKEFLNIKHNLVELAMKGIFYEVSAYPSPGLVSPVSTGAHSDMDFYTFIDSSLSLYEPLVKCVEVTANNKDISEKELFNKIRTIGKIAEDRMLDRTAGVNTHKGMIFLMFLTLSAVTRTLINNKEFSEIQYIIKQMTEDIIEKDFKQLNNKKNLTYGEKIYIKYGIDGVRGEVKRGLPTVFEYGLPEYSKQLSLNKNDRIIQTLLMIMKNCDDTTILHRHPIEMLTYVKNETKLILDLGGMNTIEGRTAIINMNANFIEKRISPGGAADLVAITIFLYEVKNKLF